MAFFDKLKEATGNLAAATANAAQKAKESYEAGVQKRQEEKAAAEAHAAEMRQIAEERAREIENAILEYGKNNTDGFFSKNTVDEIFNDLSKSIPTLSKTTVYNTLKIFAEKGAILSLTIDEKMVRFDGYNQRHAHFRCLNCNKVFDIPLNHDVEFPKEEAT